jgi:hypothetical protein
MVPSSSPPPGQLAFGCPGGWGSSRRSFQMKGGDKMESKELWALLDAIDELQDKAAKVEKGIEESEFGMDEKIRMRGEAKIYRSVGDGLKKLLEGLTSYRKEPFL